MLSQPIVNKHLYLCHLLVLSSPMQWLFFSQKFSQIYYIRRNSIISEKRRLALSCLSACLLSACISATLRRRNLVEFGTRNSHENVSSFQSSSQRDQKHNVPSLNKIMYLSHKISCMFLLKYCHIQADYKNKKGNIYSCMGLRFRTVQVYYYIEIHTKIFNLRNTVKNLRIVFV